MARPKRTKKRYMELFDEPEKLFPGVKTTLFPNGDNEMWIRSPDGKHGFSIKASLGPAGLGLTIKTFVMGNDLTVRSYNHAYGDAHPTVSDVREVNVTSYNTDPRSQAFSRWYDGQATEEDLVLLGDEYRRKS